MWSYCDSCILIRCLTAFAWLQAVLAQFVILGFGLQCRFLGEPTVPAVPKQSPKLEP